LELSWLIQLPVEFEGAGVAVDSAAGVGCNFGDGVDEHPQAANRTTDIAHNLRLRLLVALAVIGKLSCMFDSLRK
jgi:hypothetical protein